MQRFSCCRIALRATSTRRVLGCSLGSLLLLKETKSKQRLKEIQKCLLRKSAIGAESHTTRKSGRIYPDPHRQKVESKDGARLVWMKIFGGRLRPVKALEALLLLRAASSGHPLQKSKALHTQRQTHRIMMSRRRKFRTQGGCPRRR